MAIDELFRRATAQLHGLLRSWKDRDAASLLVAVSGGPDSVCLLRLLHALCPERPTLRLAVVHVQYALRGRDSELDERFTRDLAASLGLPCYVHALTAEEKTKLERESTQETARNIRRHYFETLCREDGWDGVALGHHQDDLVETMLHRLLRGTGPGGLPGMAPMGPGPYLRPLLSLTRSEILEVLRHMKQDFREDRSNASPTYLRNRIRSELLPCMEALEGSVRKQLLSFAELLAEDERAMETWCDRVWSEASRLEGSGLSFDRKVFRDLPLALRRRILRRGVRELGKRAPSRERIDAACRFLLADGPGSCLQLGQDLEIHRSKGEFRWIAIPSRVMG